MATVTVDQTAVVQTAQMRLAGIAIQRYGRMGMTSGEKAAMNALMAQGMDLMIVHWSGGYSNANQAYQQLKATDFAPTSMSTPRTYANIGGFRGLDEHFANLDALRALRPGVQMAVIMWDHPVAMLAGDTRSSSTPISPWPAASQWGGAFAGKFCTELLAKYPGKIKAFSYGQELKGVSNRTDTTELNSFAAGYTAWATYMRANHPTIELWYPHLNYWATASLSSRQSAMTALLAGGSSLQAADESIINRLMDQVDPALVDRMTYDVSILDYNPADTWRPPPFSSGTYAAIAQRTPMEGMVVKVLKAKMLARWGVVKPEVRIEGYTDVNQVDQKWQTEAQSAALQTASMMGAQREGVTYVAKWEPEGGTPGAEAPDGDIESWFTIDGVPYKAWPQARDLVTAFPPGTGMFATTSDDVNIRANAGGTNVYLLNLSPAPISVGVTATDGSLSATSIPGYGYLVRTLPAYSGGPPPIVTPPPVIPPVAGPHVVSFAPSLAVAPGVSTASHPTVTFDVAMDTATITTSTFRVKQGGTPVAGTIAFSNGDKTATFTPSAIFPKGTLFTVTLSTAITDVDGNPLS